MRTPDDWGALRWEYWPEPKGGLPSPDTHPKDGDAKQGSAREWPDKLQNPPSGIIS